MEEMNRLLEAVAVLQAEQARLRADVSEVKADLRTLMLKPGGRWDALVEKGLLCVLSAVIAAVLARIS